jgi:fimbrial isopeptide formation D2 family protein/uncharacterized repeat protein (TIGR01451 family)
MKKKKPTLTHYTKRLKKVRLARTVTVIATLFVSGVVVAANVLPQVIKSNASTAADTSSANDVIANGVNQYNGAAAKEELIRRVYKTETAEAQSARALYAKFGVTQRSIENSTFGWMYGPNVSGQKVEPWIPIGPYANWRSFGRKDNTGYIPLDVTYGANTARFYHKPFKDVMPNWSNSAGGTSAMPYLKDTSGNNAASKWFIALTCGNIVVPSIPSNPTINFTKEVASVTRANQPVNFNASGFKLQLKDQIKYKISGKNGSETYPAGLQLADAIPAGTKFVRQGGDGWPNTTVTSLPQQTIDGKTYVKWKFGAIPANQGGFTDMTVEVTAVTAPICNFAFWSNGEGQSPIGATNPAVCLPVQTVSPKVTIKKEALNPPKTFKVGDTLTYRIKMTNSGDGAATKAAAFDILHANTAGAKQVVEFASLSTPPELKSTSNGSAIALANGSFHPVNSAATQDTYANKNRSAYGYVIDSMPAKSELTFTITVKVKELSAPVCDFAAAAIDGTLVDGTADICLTSQETPRVKVTKSAVTPAANSNVSRGQTITYDIVVENPSKAAINTPITVKDTFTPPGYAKEIKVVGTSSGVTATVVTDGVNITVPKLAAGAKATVRISAKVSDTAADNTKFCNNATITTNIPGNIPSEVSSTVCHNVSLIKKAKTAKYINRTDDPQKSPANAGDEIEYTLTTTNQTSAAVSYIVTEDLADVLNYAEITDNGGGVLTDTKLIWAAKNIPAGGSITNKFKVKVKDPIPNNQPSVNNPNSYDYNMFNNYGNDVNIKINKPLIQQVVDVATNLPETGAAQYGLVIFFLGLSVYFFVRNKQLTGELAAATVEYQHQASTAQMTQAQSLIHPEDDVTPEPPVQTPPTV